MYSGTTVTPTTHCTEDRFAPAYRVSVPGRTEVAGNHQDHQGGCVIASAIDRRVTCEITLRSDTQISVASQGYEPFVLDFGEPGFSKVRDEEKNTTRSIVRGMAVCLLQRGVDLVGCELAFSSDVPSGGGLSSSAAFELCAGAALLAAAGGAVVEDASAFSGAGCASGVVITPMDMARMALRVEQEYFGKPCGLMDQAACALGGVLHMDFQDLEDPVIDRLSLPASWQDYSYVLVDCGASHAETNDHFAQLAYDYQAVAKELGVAHLREVGPDVLLARFGEIRSALGDLAALRGLHFYRELDFVERRLSALKDDDMPAFIALTERSGVSSAEYLQNVSIPGTCGPAATTLALCRTVLDTIAQQTGDLRGSARIHGGGFGGTIQVILPRSSAAKFKEDISDLLGSACWMEVSVGQPGIEIIAL